MQSLSEQVFWSNHVPVPVVRQKRVKFLFLDSTYLALYFRLAVWPLQQSLLSEWYTGVFPALTMVCMLGFCYTAEFCASIVLL